jgi:hypothetical protein
MVIELIGGPKDGSTMEVPDGKRMPSEITCSPTMPPGVSGAGRDPDVYMHVGSLAASGRPAYYYQYPHHRRPGT